MKVIHVNNLPRETIHEALSVNRIVSVGQSATKLQTFNRATLPPGAYASSHTHDDCEEIFYFLDGQADVRIDETKVSVTKDDVVIIERGEEHEIMNTSAKPLTYLSIRILM